MLDWSFSCSNLWSLVVVHDHGLGGVGLLGGGAAADGCQGGGEGELGERGELGPWGARPRDTEDLFGAPGATEERGAGARNPATVLLVGRPTPDPSNTSYPGVRTCT